jgi:PAS domain S-box-containing protein
MELGLSAMGMTADAKVAAGSQPAERRVQSVPGRALLGLYVLQRGRFVHVSAPLAEILGYSDPAQLTGQSLWEKVHPQDRQRVRLVAKAPESYLVESVETVRLIKKDGTPIQVCFKGGNTLYQGKPANIGCLIDMTALTLMKLALEKCRTMISEVDDAIGELDLKGNVIFSNTSVCRKWETLGDKSKTLNFRTYVDEPSVPDFIAGYKKVYDTDQPGKHIVYQVRLADGQRLTVEDSVSPMHDEEGAISGFRIVSRNITDRIAAERELVRQSTQLEAIFRSVRDAIITVDPDCRIIEANLAAETICGLNREKCIGKAFSDCMPECQRSCIEMMRQTIENKKAFKEQPIECGGLRGSRQSVSLSSSPLLDPGGRFIGAVLVIRDITHLQRMEQELRQRHQSKNIIGQSPKMKEIFSMVQKLADLEITVLITGENGTGKELVAKALHYSGRRASKPFVAVNCSALNESLLESELFGHAKGAFTGAVRAKQGRFEAADGGTLLLDEIGDISPLIQLKLLRMLEEKSFERVGETVTRKANVRIITSTNKDLREKIRSGAFREDLYYRLKVMQIHIPPLRQRVEDIPLLVEHFRSVFNQRLNKQIKSINYEVLRRFMNHPWPGNVRQLEHLMERAFVLCRGSEIRPEHLPMEMDVPAEGGSDDPPQCRQDLSALLKANRWNKTRTAGVLGISRQTLYRKLKVSPMAEEQP